MADKGNDPAEVWRTMIGEMEKGFNSFANQAMTSPEFSKAMNQVGGVTAGAQKQLGELMEKYRKSFSVKDAERIRLAKEVWKIALDEMWMIPVVSNSPASQGVRVIKTNMGNIPERLWNSAVSDNPHIAHTETWFFKS